MIELPTDLPAELEQATALASAMLHGDPASSEILVQGVKGKVKEFLHR